MPQTQEEGGTQEWDREGLFCRVSDSHGQEERSVLTPFKTLTFLLQVVLIINMGICWRLVRVTVSARTRTPLFWNSGSYQQCFNHHLPRDSTLARVLLSLFQDERGILMRTKKKDARLTFTTFTTLAFDHSYGLQFAKLYPDALIKMCFR